MPEGWRGWDEYAPFYDWENARTLGNRDVPFWRQLAKNTRGPVLELGCGTGRVSAPLVRAGVTLVGIDRSDAMLARARKHTIARRPRLRRRGSLALVRGDIRHLPFAPVSFGLVIAPYGVLQSMVRPRDLSAALASVSKVLRTGGRFGMELVPDVPRWKEYRNRVQLRGRAGRGHLTLVESVRQDRPKRLTIFEQKYIEHRGTRAIEHRFELTFRTLTVRAMVQRIESAGFIVDAIHGDYKGAQWDTTSDVWLILARKAARRKRV